MASCETSFFVGQLYSADVLFTGAGSNLPDTKHMIDMFTMTLSRSINRHDVFMSPKNPRYQVSCMSGPVCSESFAFGRPHQHREAERGAQASLIGAVELRALQTTHTHTWSL